MPPSLADIPSLQIAPLSNADLDDASHDLLDGLHYLLLTSPSFPSLPSAAPELSSLELALLDVAIRAEGLDVAEERAAVRERWAGVEGKWTARTTRVLALEDRQAGIVAALVEKVRSLSPLLSLVTVARSSRADARLPPQVADLELQGEQAQARTRRLEANVAASKSELEQQKERAERAEAKLEAKPSQRVVRPPPLLPSPSVAPSLTLTDLVARLARTQGLLLEDLNKLTAARDALSAELDDARSALASAQSDLGRLRRPSSAFLSSTTRTSTSPALDRTAGPSTAASPGEPEPDRERALLEAELRRAREAHDADRMITDERVRALRAEADELRRALARRAAAAASSSSSGGAGSSGAAAPAGATLVGAAIERELEGARAELAKKGFVLLKLAEKVKELNRELEGKARENGASVVRSLRLASSLSVRGRRR